MNTLGNIRSTVIGYFGNRMDGDPANNILSASLAGKATKKFGRLDGSGRGRLVMYNGVLSMTNNTARNTDYGLTDLALRPGEEILWHGRPDLRQFVQRELLPKAARLIGLTLLACLVILYVVPNALPLHHRSHSGVSNASMPWQFAAFGLGVTLLLVGSSLFEAWGTFYTVSNFRAIITRRFMGSGKSIEIPSAMLRNARLIDFGNGFGTIRTPSANGAENLACLRDVQAVYKVVTGDHESTIFSGSEVHRDISTWFYDPFTSKLEVGEKFIWTGGSDVDAFALEYQRRQVVQYKMTVTILFGVMMVMLLGIVAIRPGETLSFLGLFGVFAAISLAAMTAGLAVVNSKARGLAESACYAVTNRHIMIFQQYSPQAWTLAMMELAATTPELKEVTTETATITFSCPDDAISGDGRGGPMEGVPAGFAFIRDGAKVLKVIEDAKAELIPAKDAYSE